MIKQKKLLKCFRVYANHSNRFYSIFLMLTVVCGLYAICGLWTMDCGLAFAAEKKWDGGGDNSSWVDGDNWYSNGIPTAADDVAIDSENVSVTCDRTFKAKSIIVGGRKTSTLAVDNFVYGSIEPAAASDIALSSRKGGLIVLKGAGTITIKGKYKASKGVLAEEPSFIFWAE